MFFRRAEHIKPWMRPTYLTMSTFLGFLLSIVAHVLIETWWLSYAQSHNIVIQWNYVGGACALPLWLKFGLPVVGIIGGFMMGRVWWQWIYVERKWEKEEGHKQ